MSRAWRGGHLGRALLSESTLSPIRILLAAMPGMMRDIVEMAIRSQPDMVIVGLLSVVGARDALSDAVQHGRPDVVIVGLEADTEPHACEDLLYDHPRVRLLEVIDDGRRATLCELRPHRVPIGNVSPEGLVGAIRAATSVGMS
jgi:DNA-binding NarL/FixJ family response regulator